MRCIEIFQAESYQALDLHIGRQFGNLNNLLDKVMVLLGAGPGLK